MTQPGNKMGLFHVLNKGTSYGSLSFVISLPE